MDLPQIIAVLEKIDEEADSGGTSRMLLEIAKAGSKKEEVVIRGNREGLVHLALLCLDLAERKAEGSHHQFDESSTTSAEIPVVITYKSAS